MIPPSKNALTTMEIRLGYTVNGVNALKNHMFTCVGLVFKTRWQITIKLVFLFSLGVFKCFLFYLYRNNVWNKCPPGYYLSGVYGLDEKHEGMCCKPSGAPNFHEECGNKYIYRVVGNILISCNMADDYITGFFKADCGTFGCVRQIRCCKLQATNGW